MFGLFKNPLYIICGVVLIAAVASGVFYVKHNESVKQQLLAENAKLIANAEIYKDALNTQEQTIEYMQKEQIKRAAEFLKIESTFAVIRDDNQELNDKLLTLEESLDAVANPQAAEVVLNQISNNMNRCFELLSGASLTEAERKAKNASEFNPQCPWFYTDRTND